MAKRAFVFPGQGSQYTGMCFDLYNNHSTAKVAFVETDRRLGIHLSKVVFDGPEEDLTLTANAQPGILTASVAAWRVLDEEGITTDYVAGHSLGEYSAIVAAGGLSLADAAYAVRRRGELMQDSVPVGQGKMAAILGLDLDVLEQICTDAAGDQVVSVANINCPGQIVIAGHTEAVERAVEKAKGVGAKRAIMLQVSAPFHCRLMEPARVGMQDVLEETEISNLGVPLVNNADVEFLTDGETIKRGLLKQIVNPVRWQETVGRLIEAGVDTFVEIGPGKVLSGLIRRVDRSVRVLGVEDEKSLQMTVRELRR